MPPLAMVSVLLTWSGWRNIQCFHFVTNSPTLGNVYELPFLTIHRHTYMYMYISGTTGKHNSCLPHQTSSVMYTHLPTGCVGAQPYQKNSSNTHTHTRTGTHARMHIHIHTHTHTHTHLLEGYKTPETHIRGVSSMQSTFK